MTAPDAPDPPAAAILRDAAAVVSGARRGTNGPPERSFHAVAALWTAYLANRRDGPAAPVTAPDAAWMLALLKVARAIQGEPVRDHHVDCAGYAALAGELAAAQVADA